MSILSDGIGIDLGTASVLVYIAGKGIVLREPSVVAVDTNEDKTVAFGLEARHMLGRTPGNIVAVRPLRDGVISNYRMTERMLKYYITKASRHKLMRPSVVICVPCGVTDVERRAVTEAAMRAGARRIELIEEPVAAAIGAGIDISKPCGRMIVDIGGGTCDIAVLSLGGIVTSLSVRSAGDRFDENIIRYIRKKHNIAIGERTAEEIKINIGNVDDYEDGEIVVRGRSLLNGLPEAVTVSGADISEALREPAELIADSVRSVLERTPPELIGDISTSGILLTGGGSLIKGLDRMIARETGIDVTVAKDALSCVARGTGKIAERI